MLKSLFLSAALLVANIALTPALDTEPLRQGPPLHKKQRL